MIKYIIIVIFLAGVVWLLMESVVKLRKLKLQKLKKEEDVLKEMDTKLLREAIQNAKSKRKKKEENLGQDLLNLLNKIR